MARGWESKSVEAQIESAAVTPRKKAPKIELTPQQVETLRTKEHLELSRTRVMRELSSSTNPRYQVILRKGLADLEEKLGALEPASAIKAAVAG